MNLYKTTLAAVAAAISGTTLHAATISMTDTNGDTQAEWTRVATFSKFDPSLGTLTSVDVLVTTIMNVAETLKNTGTASQTFQFQMTEDVHFQDAGQLVGGDALSASAQTPYTLAAGASTTVTTNVSGANLTYTGITTPAVLAAYTGSGTFTFTVSTLTGASIYSGGGDITATNDPVVTANVEVVYHYTPAASLPPNLGIGLYSNQPAVYFPANGNGNFTLQMATNLSNPNWVTVTNYIPLTGFLVTNAPSHAFFRLN
jgi:hypothetical protein